MKKYKVTFYPDNKQIEVGDGENLLEAAMAADVHINSQCGGEGTCGRCRILVDEGDVEVSKTLKLSEDEVKKGYSLACQTIVKSDVKILIPPESRLGSVPTEEEETVDYGRVLSAVEEADRISEIELDPPVRKIAVKMSPPTLDDNVSDTARLLRALNAAGTEGSVSVSSSALPGLARAVREKEWSVTATLLSGEERTEVLKVEAGDTTDREYAVAVDVGTTTVVVKLIDLKTKEAVGEASAYNAQISCGEDVISRIVFSSKGNGLKRLQGLVIDTVNGLVKRLIQSADVAVSDISHMTAAGNTIMLHLLLGLDPKYLREEPYIPTVTVFPRLNAASIGFELDERAPLFLLPCVASYLGADIVAGIVAADAAGSEGLFLYIDIGTNGEMVLGNQDMLISCSCSAGPAFEGGGVKFGMRATAGAIEEVAIDAKTHEPAILTIGGRKATGICGSGLIDLMAEMFLAGVIDPKGKIDLDLDSPRVRAGENGPEYVLVWEKDTGTDRDIVITEPDIDNLMRAKAAVFAAITVLLDSIGMTVDAVDRVMIAGAFGKHVDAKKAMTIGLLPELPSDRFTFIGNGSLWGAHFAAISKAMMKRSNETAKRMTYLDLSTNNKFMDGYVSALFLPHTDMSLFPSVANMLKK